MLDNHDNRNLSDVFRELQQAQTTNTNKHKRKKSYVPRKNFTSHFRTSSPYKNYDLKLSHIIVGCGILIVGLAVLFPKNTSFTQSYAREETIEEISEYELNRHRLNIQNIISENADMDRVKEQVTEERDIEFETEYNNNQGNLKEEHMTYINKILDSNTKIINEFNNFLTEVSKIGDTDSKVNVSQILGEMTNSLKTLRGEK